MQIRNFSFVALLSLAAYLTPVTYATNQGSTDAPFGIYEVVALRNASDVATTADPGAGTEWLGQIVFFGEGDLTWFGDEICELWSVREADTPVVALDDPNLSDLAIGPVNSDASSGDKRVNVSVDLICQDDGEEVLGSFVIVDARVLVVSMSPWTVNLVLEQPLTEDQVGKFQKRLIDMKFYDGEVTAELDKNTLQAVGFYADYRGSEFRFFRTAITENLLDGLGVLGN